jgi:hypothetical protein
MQIRVRSIHLVLCQYLPLGGFTVYVRNLR